jgi:hypothetical protein
MPIQVAKIIRPLPLAEYAKEMKNYTLDVWVNPTRAIVRQFTAIKDEPANDTPVLDAHGNVLVTAADRAYAEWYSVILSQGAADKRLSADDLLALYDEDPALWTFIATGCWQLIDELKSQLPKKQVRP